MRTKLVAFIAVFLLFCYPLLASDVVCAVRFGHLIDGKGKTWTDAVVLVRNGKIEKVATAGEVIPPGTTLIDLRQYTGMPGMIDVHTHMTFWWDSKAGTRPWAQLGQQRPAFLVYMAQENARKTLETGVTTVRDLGSSDYDDIVMRDLINRGAMVGPRMFVAGCGLSVNRLPPASMSSKCTAQPAAIRT
jgi:imidazolonepropionase-like amidohydrolase